MKATILAAVLLLAACATAPAPIADPRAVWCEQNDPQRPTEAHILKMTRAEIDKLNAYNDRGVEWCGWTFP